MRERGALDNAEGFGLRCWKDGSARNCGGEDWGRAGLEWVRRVGAFHSGHVNFEECVRNPSGDLKCMTVVSV